MQHADILWALILVMGLVALYAGPWQWVWTDFIRDAYFEARMRLFEVGADGELEFDSNQYRSLETFINQTIRVAHGVSLGRLMVIHFLGPVQNGSSVWNVVQVIDNDAVRLRVTEILDAALARTMFALLVRSPLLAVVVLSVVAVRAVARHVSVRAYFVAGIEPILDNLRRFETRGERGSVGFA